jgi:hypothetical protein
VLWVFDQILGDVSKTLVRYLKNSEQSIFSFFSWSRVAVQSLIRRDFLEMAARVAEILDADVAVAMTLLYTAKSTIAGNSQS